MINQTSHGFACLDKTKKPSNNVVDYHFRMERIELHHLHNQSGRNLLHYISILLLSFYISFVFIGKKAIEMIYQNPGYQKAQLWMYFFVFLLFVGISYFLLDLFFKKMHPLFKLNTCKDKLSIKLFLAVFLFVLGFYLVLFGANYPGGFSNDTASQWAQAHTMELHDHHPAFHTLLLAFLTLFCDSYPFVILIQLVAFSIGIAYLAATLRAWGVSLTVVLVTVFILVFCPQTQCIVFFAWKDTAMSLFLLFLLPQMINIFLTKGAWLQKRSHWIALAVLCACITLVRHNAILLTLPLLFLLVLTYRQTRRSCLSSIALFLVLFWGVKGPVYKVLDVTPSPNNYIETVGMPMTILSSAYSHAPDDISDEVYQFMSSFAPQKEFKYTYTLGNFNSVKWEYDFSQEKVSALVPSPVHLLSMTWDTVKRVPVISAMSVIELTDMVWEPVSQETPYLGVWRAYYYADEKEFSLPASLKSFCQEVTTLVNRFTTGPIFWQLSSQLGILILLMLLAWYFSQKTYGWSSLWLIVPFMLYNFGTMLLLCADDYRFFHFNCLVAYPMLILLLSQSKVNTEDIK